MSNPNLEAQIKERLELKRMREELDAEIAQQEDAIKSIMGDEETLLAGAFKVSWKSFTSSRLDSTALKKALPEIAEQFTRQTTIRRLSINEKPEHLPQHSGNTPQKAANTPGSMAILSHWPCSPQ